MANRFGFLATFPRAVAGDAGGGSSQFPDAGKSQEPDPKEDPKENKEETKLLDDGNIWDTVTSDKDDKAGKTSDAPAPQTEPVDPGKALQDYVKTLDFGLSASSPALQEAMRDGDAQKFADILTAHSQNLFSKVIVDVGKMVNASEARVREDALTQTKAAMSVDESKKTLRAAVPLVENPNIAPIAEAIKSRFIEKGDSDAEANGKVAQFFKEMSEVTREAFAASDSAPPGTPSGDFNSHAKPTEYDWGSILKPDPPANS